MHYANDLLKKIANLSQKARILHDIDKFKLFELKNKGLYSNARVCVPKFGKHRFNIMINLS